MLISYSFFGGIQFRALLPQFLEETRVYFKFEATDIEFTVSYTDSLDIVVSSEEIGFTDRIQMYPNPALNQLNLNNIKEVDRILVSTITGREVIERSLNDNNYILDLSNLKAGIYFMQFYSKEGETGTLKFIKQ